MEQATFSELEHDSRKRRTRREVFLGKMERLIPWERLGKPHRTVPPEAGPRPPAAPAADDAAGALRTVVPHPERFGHGGPAPRGLEIAQDRLHLEREWECDGWDYQESVLDSTADGDDVEVQFDEALAWRLRVGFP
jgi:hypothetical protein